MQTHLVRPSENQVFLSIGNNKFVAERWSQTNLERKPPSLFSLRRYLYIQYISKPVGSTQDRMLWTWRVNFIFFFRNKSFFPPPLYIYIFIRVFVFVSPMAPQSVDGPTPMITHFNPNLTLWMDSRSQDVLMEP